jgi:hypothetical protein
MFRGLTRAFGDSNQERAWFLLCSLIALVAVWGHRYPVGVDLPQHANLFRLWTELSSGPLEYRELYRVELFTPYLLPYALAYPFTKLFGALAAVKLLFSAVAIATPLLMRRWLSLVGADGRFGLVGFVVAFDFPYVWGFFSNVVALPLVFAYLASFEEQGERPSIGHVAATSALAIALFLSHGITFGLAASAAGVSFLLRGGWFKRWRGLLHFVPPTLVAVAWLAVRHKQAGSHPIQDYLNWDRIVTLFSGHFLPYPDEKLALVAASAVVFFLVLARPRVGFGAGRVAPFTIAALGFLLIPDWIASTWLVGSRLCVFVHAFAPALLVPRESDRVARQWLHVLGALCAAFLVFLNVRLAAFNQELSGMDEIARRIPAGMDLQTLVPETDSNSPTFGGGQLGQAPAWITAEQGGLIENDSGAAIYYQIPIKRNPVPFPAGFRYAIAHGEYRRHAGQLRRLTGSPAPIARSGEWLLFERSHIETADYVVVRDAQGWGRLAENRSIAGSPLEIAGVKYASGLGAHADSFVRLRFKRAAQQLRGKCGIDASAGRAGQVQFQIRDDDGKVLFESPLLQGGAPAVPFAVPLAGRRELLLEARAPHGIGSAHADWVELVLE